jgi:flagellar basal-body rod protein FlgB
MAIAAMTEALSRYLDLSADAVKLTAGNMANLDTPGYKTQGFDFDHEFAAALRLPAGTVWPGPKTAEVDGLVARPDGNTVSIDRESMELAKAQLKFRMGISLLKHEFAGVLSAIHAGDK